MGSGEPRGVSRLGAGAVLAMTQPAQPERSILTAGLFTSRSDDWATPQPLFDSLNAEFGPFDVDVCADAENRKCVRYWDRDADGLAQDWRGLNCWMNPPYGREIAGWVRKAATGGARRVVALLPARTDTAYWHDYVIPYASEIRFLRGRVRFSGKGPAPFPSAVVVFG